MCEKLQNQFKLELFKLGYNATEISKLSDVLEVCCKGYNIQETTTELATVQYGLPDAVKYYLIDCKVRKLSNGSIKNKRLVLVRFFEWVRKTPNDVTINDINVWLIKYESIYGTKIKDCTLEKYRESIVNFFSWAYDEEYITKDIGRKSKPIKYDREKRGSMNKDQLEYFREACASNLDRALVEFLYSTGVRIGEMCNVTLNDVDWVTRTVRVYGEKTNAWRDVYLSSAATILLNKYIQTERKGDSEYLFVTRLGGKFSADGARKRIKKLSNVAKPNTHMDITPHILRHTFATQTMPASNLTVYRYFNRNYYTVTLDDNGGKDGSGSVSIQYKTVSDNYPEIIIPYYKGHGFLGYFDAKEGGTQWYDSSGNALQDFTLTENTTWYAPWELTTLGCIYIYDETTSSFKLYRPYVYTNDEWKQVIAYVRNNDEWKPTTG